MAIKKQILIRDEDVLYTDMITKEMLPDIVAEDMYGYKFFLVRSVEGFYLVDANNEIWTTVRARTIDAALQKLVSDYLKVYYNSKEDKDD